MGFFRFIGGAGAEYWNYAGLNLNLAHILGKGYVIEHCVSLFKKEMEERAFREYLTSSIDLLNQNYAEKFGGRVKTVTYTDAMTKKPMPEKTGDEIAAELILKMGLKHECIRSTGKDQP